jgi:hypothetical protein
MARSLHVVQICRLNYDDVDNQLNLALAQLELHWPASAMAVTTHLVFAHTVLHYTALCRTALHCTAMHCTALHRAVLYCIALRCILLYSTAL